MVNSFMFEIITNMFNRTNAIERPWSGKHFKPIFDIWDRYEIDFFEPYPGVGGHSRGGSVRIFRVVKLTQIILYTL